MRKVFGFDCGSVCVAMTCSTSEVPMPKASAPKAPCVEVCESPQTMVMPGLVAPSSGPIMCTMPWLASCTSKNSMPNSAQFAAQRVYLSRGDLVGDDEAVLRAGGGHVVVHGGDVAIRPAQLAASQAQAIEGLRRCDLVDEVEVDVEDGRFAFRLGDDVLLPDLLKERLRLGHRCVSFM